MDVAKASPQLLAQVRPPAALQPLLHWWSAVLRPRCFACCACVCSSCWSPISRSPAAHGRACLQSLDEAAELFEADDPLLAECAARVLARAGQYMRAHCEQSKREVPKEVSGQ